MFVDNAGDLKSPNVLYDKQLHVKLCDFAFSKFKSQVCCIDWPYIESQPMPTKNNMHRGAQGQKASRRSSLDLSLGRTAGEG